jgi:hypothetical protein
MGAPIGDAPGGVPGVLGRGPRGRRRRDLMMFPRCGAGSGVGNRASSGGHDRCAVTHGRGAFLANVRDQTTALISGRSPTSSSSVCSEAFKRASRTFSFTDLRRRASRGHECLFVLRSALQKGPLASSPATHGVGWRSVRGSNPRRASTRRGAHRPRVTGPARKGVHALWSGPSRKSSAAFSRPKTRHAPVQLRSPRHSTSGTPARWLVQRASTNKRSPSRFR